jgi:pre-mRNA-splicing factor ISY1
MARNSEKAQSMLFRFRAQQAAESGLLQTAGQRRPRAPNAVDQIPLCEKWRGQILKEVSRKILKIQEESLSDFQIRDLNDEINKLMKEKWGWERRIRELGGPNYMRSGAGGVVFDDQGREVPGGGKGYRYFGRAKELPGVKEMFERAAKKRSKGTDDDEDDKQKQMIDRRNLDANYFGYGLDEEDGTLLKYERRKEREAVEKLGSLGDSENEDADWEPLPGDAGDGTAWRLPTLDEVQEELMNRKRRQILENLG